MEIIRCPRCAKEIHEASAFCRRCGCALARGGAAKLPPTLFNAAPVPLPPIPATPPTRIGPRPGAKPKPAPAAGAKAGVIGLIGVAAAAVIGFNGSHSRRPATAVPDYRDYRSILPATPAPMQPHPTYPSVTYPQPARPNTPAAVRKPVTTTPPRPGPGPTIPVQPDTSGHPFYEPRTDPGEPTITFDATGRPIVTFDRSKTPGKTTDRP